MTGVAVAVTVAAEPPSDKPRAGAVVTLTNGDEVHQAVTSASGVATFPDVDPGDYDACVTAAPAFFLAPTTNVSVTVAQAAATASLSVTPLVLTLRSTPPPPGTLDFEQVEVWQVGGAKVTIVELEAPTTPVPIPALGDYQVRTVRPLPGRLQPPDDAGPKVRFSRTRPAIEVQVPERTATLKLAVKVGAEAASAEDTAAVAIKVQDALGVVPPSNDPVAGTTLRRTGEHTATVTDLPAGLELVSGSPYVFEVDWKGAPNASTSEVTQVVTQDVVLRKEPEPKGGRASLASLVIVVLLGLSTVVCFAANRGVGPFTVFAEKTMGSLVPSLLVLTIGLLILHLAGHAKHGIFEPLVGVDGRTSVSRMAPALWTLALVVVMCRNAGIVSWNGDKLAKTLDDNWEDYLILLGGPWTAAVLARATVSWKVENGTLQKTSRDEPEILDAIRDDNGQTSLVDAQYLLFNIVALMFFAAAYVAEGPDLPKIPGLLLALTSGAAAIYVGNKAAEQNRPAVTGLVPPSVRAGDELTISGQNLIPAGTTAADGVTVSLSGYGVLPPVAGKKPTNTKVVVQVPANVPAGYHDVTVTTAAKVTTEPRSLEVVSADLVVVGLVESAVVPGETVHLLIENLRTRPDGQPMTYLVAFDGQWVQARLTGERQPRLEVTTPRSLTGSTVAVSVRDGNGRTSGATSVAVDGGPKIVAVTATRITGRDEVQVVVDAVGVLPPAPTAGDLSAIRIGDAAATTSERRTVAGSRDRLVVTAPLVKTAKSITVTAVDWTGRTSTPRPVPVT